MSAHKSRIFVLIAVALLAVMGLGWRYVDASSSLSGLQGTWHLKQVSDGRVTTAPTKPASLEFVDTSLKADDGTNISTIKLLKADKHVFFIGSGTTTAVGYGPTADARQALSRAPIQQLLTTGNAVTYAKISNQLVLRIGGYTYTLVH